MTTDDQALEGLYASVRWQGPDDRPAVAIGMVASVDGAATVDGRSTGLGGDADLQAFRRLREAADVILVGAGTVRAEDYGPATVGTAARERRVAAGRPPQPELAIVTASVDLDPNARVFGDPDLRPVIVTTQDHPARLSRLVPDHAEVVFAGDGRVRLLAALQALGERGHGLVLCEGGPSLNAQLFADGLVDELFVTVAPSVVGRADRRIVEGSVAGPVDLQLCQSQAIGDEVLLRYRVRGT